ncbi:MAG: SDR family NAD(P)-dependent oxidoreductase [Thermodesulfovibrionales bacterium]|nr:SDR family NAD(P)-dependent oxidoreductase [Thermodesulfovibrionales bacterium]
MQKILDLKGFFGYGRLGLRRLIPEMSLKNKTVIISGATRGIGRAIAIELAREGASISFNFLKSNKDAEDLEKEIKYLGATVLLDIFGTTISSLKLVPPGFQVYNN